MDDISTAQVPELDPSRLLFIGWLDDCGAAFCDTLIKWTAHMFPGVEVARAPDVRADPQWKITLPRSLRGAEAALVCVVGEQAASPWLHLQLGVCFRALGTSRPVVPVLLDVPDTALSSSPIGLFQGVRPTKEDFRRLVRDLSYVLANPSTERSALERFESSFDDLLSDLDLVPGPVAPSFQVVLVLPDRVLPVPNSAPYKDEDWNSVLSRMTAIQSLPNMGLIPFKSTDLECLDLAREEWMRAPRLVSRLTTRNVALVHRAVSAKYQREAKAIAKYVKHHLMKYEQLRLQLGSPPR
jgi:hypothetical protein